MIRCRVLQIRDQKKLISSWSESGGHDSLSLVKAYEEQIKKLEGQKAGLVEKKKIFAAPHRDFNQTFRTSLEFFRNPQKLWFSKYIEDKKLVLKLVFARPLEYCQKSGFRTPLTSCPFTLFRGFSTPNKVLVDVSGGISNENVLDELLRWGTILKYSPTLSTGYSVGAP